jgi:hypothetical protein
LFCSIFFVSLALLNQTWFSKLLKAKVLSLVKVLVEVIANEDELGLL